MCHGHRDGGQTAATKKCPTVLLFFTTGPVCVSYSTSTARQSLFTPSHSKFLLTLNPSRVSCVCGQFFYRSSGIDFYSQRSTGVYFDLQACRDRDRTITTVSCHDGPYTS